MKLLAIEREFGSGGREIGQRVAETAGIPCYDTNLLLKAAKTFGEPVGQLQDYDEKKTGSFLYNLAMAVNYSQGNGQDSVYQLYYSIKKTILRLAEKEPAIFIGRSATEILKDRQNVLRVYIYSSDKDRKIRRIMNTEQVTEQVARKLMEKRDKERRNYFRFWTEKEWDDRNNYDLELNTGKLSAEACAEILLYAIGK